MAILAKANSGSGFEPVAMGAHPAVCYSIIDLGVQVSEKFSNKSRKIMIIWELPFETIEIDGETKPRAINKEYTLSLADKANLRKELEAWRGKAFTKEEMDGFDLKNVLGKACQVQVIHKQTSTGNTRANVSAVMGLPKGMTVPAAQNPLMYFDLTESDCTTKINDLPEWIQLKIKQSETWQNLGAIDTVEITGTAIDADNGIDDMPF